MDRSFLDRQRDQLALRKLPVDAGDTPRLTIVRRITVTLASTGVINDG